MNLYLSRIKLNSDAPMKALAGILDPNDINTRMDINHRLIWTLFSDGSDQTRDFLWRADLRRQYFTLSSRLPQANDLFGPIETKEFSPNLKSGDKLGFVLRVNATRAKQFDEVSRRVDVVMELLHEIEPKHRAEQRLKLADRAASDWMNRQSETRGFVLRSLTVEDYHTIRIKRGPGNNKAVHGILDLRGTLDIDDPDTFLSALSTGFGRAKAWGCGLMLIRRIP
ncbi:MAG: type I-E CRISPR-associated protein Cas6/Cse3/CasE [Gammaproteobacteria bacterium]|nr:type I-E CRISPR-associated protein Cas6/Cse3/CasE [Gammaproteobacteria bacterium]